MAKSIVVVGFGPGISSAVAERFGRAGFAVALVARNEQKLAAGVEALRTKGIEAAGFAADAGDPASIRTVVRKASAELGPVAVLHWNAYGGPGGGDLATADERAMRSVFDVAIVGLTAAVQEALPDLKKAKDAAVLVTNGSFADVNPQVDAFAVASKNAGLALANAAKHKLVGLLAKRLEGEGVYVGEVMVAGTIKGTAWDSGNASLDASTVADAFWKLYEKRSDVRVRVG